jgi:TfuA protein
MLQPDEILRAIARGVDVRGSSSIGALRAAELHGCGMAGVGWVYDSYRANRIAGLDEIAVIYDPQSYRPLTIPLVNIRFCLDRLVESNASPTTKRKTQWRCSRASSLSNVTGVPC